MKTIERCAMNSDGPCRPMAIRSLPRRTPPILDIGLPNADGRDVCLTLRTQGVDAPVLMLTAPGGTHHKVSGFEARA